MPILPVVGRLAGKEGFTVAGRVLTPGAGEVAGRVFPDDQPRASGERVRAAAVGVPAEFRRAGLGVQGWLAPGGGL